MIGIMCTTLLVQLAAFGDWTLQGLPARFVLDYVRLSQNPSMPGVILYDGDGNVQRPVTLSWPSPPPRHHHQPPRHSST